MDGQRDLTLALKSRFPIVTIESAEEPRVLKLLAIVCALESLALFVWSVTSGLRRDGRAETIAGTQELGACLRHIAATEMPGAYVLLDAQPFMDDPINRRLVREIALDYERTARTVVFISPKIELTADLARMSARFTVAVPSLERVRSIARHELREWQRANGTVRGDPESLEAIVRQLVGLPEDDIVRLVRQAVADDGMITRSDVRRLLKQKHDLHSSASVLSLELDVGSFADVAGQANLKRWLATRHAVFAGGAALDSAHPLDPPKGILLLGVQGSGKSLAAKAVAGTWGLPLLRLDFGTLYNKFYGETERNLREALAAAEAMAPAVLWIDEIEKGIAADSQGEMDGGVSRRVLGTLLTWMAERKSQVFMVATANDISALPPELLRKGRFDEIFFVDLPSETVRTEIFALHLARRKQAPEQFDLAACGQAADGFSGAEIEQAIVSALYEARAHNMPLTTAHILEEVKRTKPLSVVMAEDVQALRDWARERTVPAD